MTRSVAFGQGVSTVHYSLADGLPSSQVYDVIQDRHGNIWFCTDKGLSRYNGYEFKNFDKNDGLPDNVIFNFFERENGEIWCSTRSLELFKIEGRNPKFIPYKFNHLIDNGQNISPIIAVRLDSNNSLFIKLKNRLGFLIISSDGKVLCRPSHADVKKQKTYLYVLKTDGKRPYFYTDTSNSYITFFDQNTVDRLDTPISRINQSALHFPARNSSVFVEGKNVFLKKNNHTLQLDSTNEKPVNQSGKLKEDSFWVSYLQGGVKLFDTAGTHFNTFIPEESVTKLFIDQESNIWITTLYNGVFLIKNTPIKHITSSLNKKVSSLELADENKLYVGYITGDIDLLEEGEELVNFHHSESHSKSIIFYDTLDSTTYFSSQLLFSTRNDYITSNSSNYIIRNQDRILFGNASTIAMNPNDTSQWSLLFNRYRMNDIINYNEHIYGGNIDGLYYIEMSHESQVNPTFIKLRIDDLNTIGEYLILATNGNGVILLDKEHHLIAHFRCSDGLQSDFINQTFTQNDSTLWVCTNKGLNRIQYFDSNKFKIDYLDVNDGLLSNEVWTIAIREKQLFIGTQKGLNYFDISAFDSLQEEEDPHYFFSWTNTLVNDEPFSISEQNQFTYSENTFQFNFEAITFEKNNNFHYRYKLSGIDEKWINTKERMIRYAALPPGDYSLVIQAKSRNCSWETNEISYDFSIAPPFWSTWWFFSLITFAITGVIYLFFKLRILKYNRDIVREILRLVMRRLRKETPFILIKDKGKQVKIYTKDIHFIKTNGNYLELYTKEKTHLMRSSVNQFLEDLPDTIEFLQVHRSYLVRIDNIQEVGTKALIVLNQKIPIGRKYTDEVKLITLE